jgi:hypothetical protein
VIALTPEPATYRRLALVWGVVPVLTDAAAGVADVTELAVRVAVESGIVGAEPPPDANVFDAFSYRVTARFAGRVRIAVYPDRVAVAGPRVPNGLYWLWIWVQGLLLALVPAALTGAIVALDWRWLVAALVLALASWTTSTVGAGVWPGLWESAVMDEGRLMALESPRTAVSDVTVGAGWSNGGMAVVLAPYKKGIDGLAGHRAVSWDAPDERGHQARFAMHLYSDEAAARLAGLLRGEEPRVSDDAEAGRR